MKKQALFILFLLLTGSVIAQETLDAVVSKSTVQPYERFNYEIVTNSRCNISTPDFGGLEVVGGPNSAQYSNTSFINGVQTQSTEYRWTYQLRAKKEGSYTISPISMDCNGKTITADGIQITVKEGQQSSENEDFFMRLTTNKSSVYEGEPFVATLTYYAKIRPETIEGLDLGDAVGIWRQDLNPDLQTFKTNVETINGMRYYTILLREELCYAQRSGTVTLEPYYTSMVFSQGFFNRFRKETYSNRLSVKVKPIPQADNPDFNGLVGDFSVSSELSKDHVKVGEAIDLKITLEGKGNLQDLGAIDLKVPKEFDQFDPEINDKTRPSTSGIKGSISYNFVLIPKHYGSYTIPAYSFTYFDLKSKQMKSVSTGDFTIQVDKRKGMDIDIPQKPVDPNELDIHYIHTSPTDLFEQDDLLFGSFTYFALLLSPLALAFLFIFLKRKRDNLSEEERQKLLQKKAGKQANVALKNVRDALGNGQEQEALKLLQTTLFDFFKRKLNVPLSELSKRTIGQKLAEKGIDTNLREQFDQIWNTIEMGQYAPVAHENLLQTVSQTENLLTELDKKI